MHIHTAEVSPCGCATAQEAVRRCIGLGYGGMAVTDHFHCGHAHVSGGLSQASWRQRIDFFLTGYQNACNAAPEGFAVMLGMELRLLRSWDDQNNDYLVYGLDEDFLRKNADFDLMTLEEFRKLANKHGLLIVQAHPFRNGMKLREPELLDGIEVYNGNAHHDSRNDIAALWAKKYDLLPCSGSDYHGGDTGEGRAPGGIVLPQPVADVRQLVQALRRRDYLLLEE
jgi:predicted metal-dependent phosphoesterase TrpH